MKKLLALLLALVMVFALAACGGDSAETTTEETTTTADAAPAAEADAAAPAAETADEGDDLDGYKTYVKAYATAGAPSEDEAAAVEAAVDACASVEEVEAVSQLTVLYENVGMLTYADWVAAGKPTADTEGMVSEAVQQGSSEGSGEASGGGGGATLVEPDASYSKDFAGYLQYAKDAFASDTMAPDDMKESTNAGLEAAVDENDETIAMLVDIGLIVSYEDFLASK